MRRRAAIRGGGASGAGFPKQVRSYIRSRSGYETSEAGQVMAPRGGARRPSSVCRCRQVCQSQPPTESVHFRKQRADMADSKVDSCSGGWLNKKIESKTGYGTWRCTAPPQLCAVLPLNWQSPPAATVIEVPDGVIRV